MGNRANSKSWADLWHEQRSSSVREEEVCHFPLSLSLKKGIFKFWNQVFFYITASENTMLYYMELKGKFELQYLFSSSEW